MKWYQPIECDNIVKKPLICDYSNFEEYDYNEDDFKAGKNILNWPNNIFMKATQKKYNGNPDDALQNAYMIPTYSKQIIDELIKADIKGIQYLTIKVLNLEEDNGYKFYIANILNYVEAFDYTRSIYDRFSETFPNPNVRGLIAGVKKFVLFEEKLKGFDVIRLREYSQSFFVSEKFVNIFEKNHFTGYSFKEIELA